MKALHTLRHGLASLGPRGRSLLPELDRLELEVELRARRIAALTAANRIAAGLVGVEREQEVTQVLDSLLMAALVLTGAERGLAVLPGDAPPGFVVAASRGRPGSGNAPLQVPGTLLSYVIDRADGVVEGGAAEDGGRSVMAAPIRLRGEVLGALFVERPAGEGHWDEADLGTFAAYADAAAVALHLATALHDRRGLYQQTVLALVHAVEAVDPSTAGHAERVGRYAAAVAEELGYDPASIELVTFSGYLHDVGKIALPSGAFGGDPLDAPDWDEVRRHPLHGERILRSAPALQAILPAVRHHHERWDGRGYPDGLAGEAIHPFARIVAVADSFDAITSHRHYDGERPPEDAIAEIEAEAGRQFDPKVVAALRRAWERGALAPATEPVKGGLAAKLRAL